MAKREVGAVVTLRVFVPVEKNSTRSQIAVSNAILSAEDGHGIAALAALPGVDVLKVEHRFTSRAAAEAAPSPADVEAAETGQAGEVTVETVDPGVVDPQETGPGSVGEDQVDAVEEAATGSQGRRRRG